MFQKFLQKVRKSYEELLKLKIQNKEKSFDLIFSVPKISIKWNEKEIDLFQLEIKKLKDKFNFICLNTVKTQKWTLIESINFVSLENYLIFTDKKKDYNEFCTNLDKIYSSKLWNFFLKNNFAIFLEKKYKIVNENSSKWLDILLCIEYFLQNTKSNLYFRELPIKVSSKFIENNKKILEQILDFLFEQIWIELIWNTFEEKFWIKIKENFVRFRFLDNELKQNYFGCQIDDISLKISDFSQFNFNPNIKKIYIIENEINYLSFPKIANSIAIWWAWFNVLNLKNVWFLKEKEIYYFWDIDCHWYKILWNLKKSFPHTKSIFMDRETFNTFSKFEIEWQLISREEIKVLAEYLTEDELDMLDLVYIHNMRLEQENITEEYIRSFLFFK